MFDFSERKDLLVILIIGVLLAFAFMIFAFIMIWKPAEEKEFEVGAYVNANSIYNNITDKYKAEANVKKISNDLKNKNYEKIFSYLAKDYVSYYNMTVKSLEMKIKSLNFDGEEIYLESCTTTNLGDYLNIYILTVRGKNNDYAATMILRETSPRQFELAFDDFILYDNSIYEKSAENVSLNIVSRLYTTDYTLFNVKITNKNSSPIELNSSRDNRYIYLKISDNSVYSENLVNNGASLVLQPNQTESMNLKFNTNNVNLNNIYSLVIENVKLSNDKQVNISYSFS